MYHVAERGEELPRHAAGLAWHGWLGLALVAVFWPLNWLLPGLRTVALFFPLWLGYALAVDALVLRRTGTSILTRSRAGFAALFALSAPAWWLFELLNERTHNWEYLGRAQIGELTYVVFASLSFSTVMPAVFGTAELMRSFGWIEGFARGPRIRPRPLLLWASLLGGCSMLYLMYTWPDRLYPLMWMSIFFFLEPLCVWLGRPSLFDTVKEGDWRTVAALWSGTFACGLFWEMWNYYSYPKWVYHTPGVEFWHIFEMPALGYLGYLAFGLELHALLNLVGRRGLGVRV